MQTNLEKTTTDDKLRRIANVLRWTGWASFWLQLILLAAATIMLILAISGRSFNRAVTPEVGVAAVNYSEATTPGIGIGIFWAGCGIVVLLFALFIAFRQTRLAKRLFKTNELIHPQKSEVLQVLRWGVITGFVGMLLTILGGGTTLGVLLSKSIAQPQGVAIYDPTRIIRSLDIFVATANMNGITAHFIGTVTSLGLINWLNRQ
ncbi:DUF3611 family protein [Aerosakkonemataceae cyanobacterium BLCC-F154]|uniref:DUF3611 family protein n=1 Tax=Floridaenema fluviatile BLCC-F154 TaxID=3153640 RepID=A0ABV4Y6W1_9CYAN